MLSANYGDMKLYLRDDGDRGVLVVNAARMLYLDDVATAYFRSLIRNAGSPPAKGTIEDAVVRDVRKRFRVKREQARLDLRHLLEQVNGVVSGERCPWSDLGIEMVEVSTERPRAPYRVDLAVTYRCNNDCPHCYAGGPRVTPELAVDDWKKIIEKLVDFDLPQVVFTGGEPTLRDDLEELVEYAQAGGLVTGLITNGRLLKSKRVRSLVKAGLDYVQVTLESNKPKVHDRMVGCEGAFDETVAGIHNCTGKLYTTTNTTITPVNAGTVLDTIHLLADIGVNRFGLNAIIHAGRGENEAHRMPAEDVQEILEQASALAQEMGMDFIWYTPTRYCELDPLDLGLGLKQCSACSQVLAVEPDGRVIPCQSYLKEGLGNALTDDFREMWDSPLARYLAEYRYVDGECVECLQLHLCRGACPLEKA